MTKSVASRLGLLGVAAAALAGCSSTSTPVLHAATQPASPASRTPVGAFNVAVAVPGTADPADPAFISDQHGLYDMAQFDDARFYMRGWHWRIDTAIGSRAVRHADATYDSQSGQWVVVIEFTPEAARQFRADTEAAFQAGQGTPANHIAFFVGRDVVSAPSVINPSGASTEIVGDFTQAQAQQLADALDHQR